MAAKKLKPGEGVHKPDYRVHVLHQGTRATARVGSAWIKDDGVTIGIKLNSFVHLNNDDGQLVMTLFKED